MAEKRTTWCESNSSIWPQIKFKLSGFLVINYEEQIYPQHIWIFPQCFTSGFSSEAIMGLAGQFVYKRTERIGNHFKSWWNRHNRYEILQYFSPFHKLTDCWHVGPHEVCQLFARYLQCVIPDSAQWIKIPLGIHSL